MSEVKAEVFFTGDSFFAAVLETIDRAEKEVCLETYIFHMDRVGLEVLESLAVAVRRGVKVYLLVDGVGSMLSLAPLRTYCRQNKIHFRVYHAVPFLSWRLFRFPWLILRLFGRFARRMNARNHRKTIIVDEEKVFVGSFNVSEVHCERFQGDKAWRDTGVRIEGRDTDPLIRILREAFQQTWRRARLFHRSRGDRRLKHKSVDLGPVRLNDRLRRRFFFARDIRNRIVSAKRRILITNAYFIPRRSFLRAMRSAAHRGVFVGVCLPAKSDVWIVREASRVLYQRLLRAGVHIYEYQPTMLHAKTMVIDDWSVIGSHNLNHRSFIHDLEVEVGFDSPAVTEKLLVQWEKDVDQSKEVTLEDLYDVSLWRIFVSRLCYLFRYWL